jgi:molecular chaperone GrpE (heat shock protein)
MQEEALTLEQIMEMDKKQMEKEKEMKKKKQKEDFEKKMMPIIDLI